MMYLVTAAPALCMLVIVAISGALSEQCCMKVNNSTKQMIDPSGKFDLYKSPKMMPRFML